MCAAQICKDNFYHHRQDVWQLVTTILGGELLQGSGNYWWAAEWMQMLGHDPTIKQGVHVARLIGATPSATDDDHAFVLNEAATALPLGQVNHIWGGADLTESKKEGADSGVVA